MAQCLQFDDKLTRIERRQNDYLAPIQDVWELFIHHCVESYKPGSFLTIDEQLLGSMVAIEMLPWIAGSHNCSTGW